MSQIRLSTLFSLNIILKYLYIQNWLDCLIILHRCCFNKKSNWIWSKQELENSHWCLKIRIIRCICDQKNCTFSIFFSIFLLDQMKCLSKWAGNSGSLSQNLVLLRPWKLIPHDIQTEVFHVNIRIFRAEIRWLAEKRVRSPEVGSPHLRTTSVPKLRLAAGRESWNGGNILLDIISGAGALSQSKRAP